jgi:hypothetical protein
MIAMPPTSTACGRRDGQTNVTHERDVTEPYMALVTSVTLMDVTKYVTCVTSKMSRSRLLGQLGSSTLATWLGGSSQDGAIT